jgi:hypothetical protein
MEKKKEVKKKIELPSLNLKEVTIPIVGRTPLLMDKFPKEAKEMILAKQMGISKTSGKKIRNAKEEIEHAVHKTNKGKVGFPTDAFKRGMMDCVTLVGNKMFSKKLVQGLQIVNGEDGLVVLEGGYKQDVLEHNIKHTTKFSPQFHNWKCKLVIRFDANNISENDIATLLNYAGFYVGVGAWRPKGRDGGTGTYGMFEVENKKVKMEAIK